MKFHNSSAVVCGVSFFAAISSFSCSLFWLLLWYQRSNCELNYRIRSFGRHKTKFRQIICAGILKLTLGVSVSVHGCLSCLSLRWHGDLSRVYFALCPMTAGIGSCPTVSWSTAGQEQKEREGKCSLQKTSMTNKQISY